MSSSQVGAPPPYSTALDRLARAVLGLTSASGVWIAAVRLGGQGGGLVPVVAAGVHASGPAPLNPAEAPPVVRHIIDFAARQPYLVTSANLGADARFRGVETRPFGSILCMPVHENGQPLVALVAARARMEEFDERQRQLALVYAEQIAMTIHLLDAAALHEAQARERAALLEATRALTSGLDAVGVINAIAGSITRVIACDAALIYRCDERAKVLRVVAALGMDDRRLAGATIPIQDQRSLAARVATERKARYNAPLSLEQAGPLTGMLAPKGPAWLMCEPLIAQDRLLGVVMLARAHAFDVSEQRAIDAFAALAAAALERVELFEETHAQRDQRDTMFTSASDGFALIGSDRRFIEVNPAFAIYLGREPQELRGQISCAALQGAPDSPPGMESCLLCRGSCRVKSCLESDSFIGPFESVFPTPRAPAPSRPVATTVPRAGERIISFTITAITGAAGEQALLVGRDITYERAMESSRLEFLNMVAHDLRQPLQGIRTNLEILLDRAPADLPIEARRRYEAAALVGTLSVSARVDDLFVLTQRDHGHFTVEPAPNDLSLVARTVAEELAALAGGYRVRLDVRAPDGMPLALIDPGRVAQVTRNLLINALKFTPAGGWARVETRMEHEAGKRWVALEVADNGVGIPNESLPRIFERRYQAPNATLKGRPAGTGMGLAIVRYIMDGHRGEYRVESEPGKGSRFIMRFPLA